MKSAPVLQTEAKPEQREAPSAEHNVENPAVPAADLGNLQMQRLGAGGASSVPPNNPRKPEDHGLGNLGNQTLLGTERSPARSPHPGNTGLPHRKEFEQAFQQDFSEVEVRLGDAGGSGRGAYATVEGGRDVVAFDRTSPPREQVAHELAHVAQRRRHGDGAVGLAPHGSRAEAEARTLAPLAASGQKVSVAATPAGRVHRDDDIAQRIHDNLHGWIDDEAAALSELRSDTDRAGTVRTYQSRFGYSVWADFIANASGDILNQALALLWPHMTLIERLETMTGVDDDEAGILQTIQNASDAQVLAARSEIQPYLDELEVPDQYTARRRIWPEQPVENVVWLLGAGHGWIYDDEGPVATAILGLTAAQRATLWNDHQSAFAMFSSGDLAVIERMCVAPDGTAATDTAALTARMELATEGSGTDEDGVLAAVAVAGNRRDERARIDQALASGMAPDGTSLTDAQRAQLVTRREEIGDVESLLTPTEGADGILDPTTFLGRVEDDMDAGTVEAALVTARASAFMRAKQALFGTIDWTGNVDEAAVLRILREVQGDLTLAEGETLEGLGEAEIRRRRNQATLALRVSLHEDQGLIDAGVWSSLGDALWDDDESAMADALLLDDGGFEAARLNLVDAFEGVDTDEGRILRVLRDVSPEVRGRFRDETPPIIGRIRGWAAADFSTLFERVLLDGVIDTQTAIDFAIGGWGDGTDEEMVTDALSHLSEADRAELRRGYLLAHTRDMRADRVCAPGISLSPRDQQALDRYQALHAQLASDLTAEELDKALVTMLDIPTVAEMSGTDSQGRLDAAAIMLFRQRERLELNAGLTDAFTTDDNTAAAAHVEFEARYNEALEDGEITPDEFNVLIALDIAFNARFDTYSATANMVSEIAGTVAAVVAAAVVIVLSGGTATAASPGVIAWLSANSTLIASSAAAGALAQVATSEAMGGDFNEMLDEEGARQALSGALNGALAVCGAALAEKAASLVGLSGPSLTAAIARSAADSTAASVSGRAFARGALTGLIDGSLGGAVGELAMTLTDAQTWRRTVWGVLAQAGQALLRGGVLGGATGLAAGGLIEVAQAQLARRALHGVDVSLDSTLGRRAHIDYTLNADGALEGLALRIGPHASDVDLAAHVDRIVAIRRASSLLARARAAITGVEVPPAGTVAGDAAHEVEKIGDLIEGRLRHLNTDMSAAEREVVEAELDVLDANLEHYAGIAASGNLSPGAGGIAQPTAPPGYPSPPEGHYYRRRDSGWDLQRYPDSTADPMTLRSKGTGWEVIDRDGVPAAPAARFADGTTPSQAFDELTDPTGTSSFRAYWEMLRDNGLATRAEVIAAMRNPSGETVTAVRHELKVTFEARVMARAERTLEGVARTEAESLSELRRLTEHLDGSDRGNILERWYASRRPGLVAHPAMTDADNPGLVVGREGRGVRTPDFVENQTLVEMKSHRTRMGGEDAAQIEDGLRTSRAGGVVRLPDGTTQPVDRMRVVFTDIRGARANGDRIARWIQDNGHLTVEVFDSTGAARSLSQNSLPGFLQRYGVTTVEELLGAM